MDSIAGKKVILDSRFTISCLNNRLFSSKGTILRNLAAEGMAKCVTKGILIEVERWVGSRKAGNTLGEDWTALARKLFVLRPNRGYMIWESGHILTHSPDSQHIAAAEFESTSIVSYDDGVNQNCTR